MERMPIWHIALRRLEMPFPRYLAFFVGGAALVGLISALVVIDGDNTIIGIVTLLALLKAGLS